MDEEAKKAALSQLGKLGAAAKLKKYGKEGLREQNRKAILKRWAKKRKENTNKAK